MKTYAQLLLAFCLGLLGFRTSAQVTETHSFANINHLVPDGNWSGLSDVHSIASTVARLGALRVKLKVTGEYNGDLYCYLRHTSPTVTNFCVLLNRPGRSAASSRGYADAGLDVQFDDLAPNGNIHTYRAVSNPPPSTPLTGIWRPDGRRVDPAVVLDTTPVQTSLSSFTGVDADGTWTLFLADVDMGATNMLSSWELEITGAMTPTVTWAPPADITYGTALGTTQLNASAGAVSGTFLYQPPAGTVLTAGTHTLQTIFTPTDSATYLAVTTSVSINVLQKALTITAQDAGKSYDGRAFSGGSVTYAGFVNGETAAVLGGTLTFSGTSQGAINAGSYVITPGGLTSGNYAINFVSGSLVVSPAPLTVTANNATKTYNGVPFSGGNGVTYTGFVNGETAGVLGGALAYTGTSQGATSAGSYVIAPGGLTSGNYAVTFVNGTLIIGKAATAGTLSASANPVKPGDPVTFTFSLGAVAPGAGTPTGAVQFLIDGTAAGSPATLVGGIASYTKSGFALGSYAVSAQYAGDSNFLGTTNSLTPALLVNTSPVARPDTIARLGTNEVKVAIATLLSNDTDADGDTVTFLDVSATSTNNGKVSLAGSWIIYAPPAGSTNEDLFTYRINDGRGAPVTGSVFVQVVVEPVPSPNLVIVDQGNGSYLVQFNGIPGLRYRIEFCEDLNSPVWLPLAAATADATGLFQYVDTPPQGSPRRYYRSVYP